MLLVNKKKNFLLASSRLFLGKISFYTFLDIFGHYTPHSEIHFSWNIYTLMSHLLVSVRLGRTVILVEVLFFSFFLIWSIN